MPKAIIIRKEIINQLYHLNNLTLQQVADELCVCKDTVRRNMRRNNIPPKASDIYRKGQDTRIIRMLPNAKKLYFEDMSPVVEVCKQLGISFYTLQRLFKDNSIHFRSSGESARLAYSQHPNMGFQKGTGHLRFNGYRATKNTGGYILEYKPGHPRAGKNGYVGQHILVWEKANGKPLPKGWITHHLNGVKDDNRPENLVGLSTRAHRLVLTEKAKRIKFLEDEIRKLK